MDMNTRVAMVGIGVAVVVGGLVVGVGGRDVVVGGRLRCKCWCWRRRGQQTHTAECGTKRDTQGQGWCLCVPVRTSTVRSPVACDGLAAEKNQSESERRTVRTDGVDTATAVVAPQSTPAFGARVTTARTQAFDSLLVRRTACTVSDCATIDVALAKVLAVAAALPPANETPGRAAYAYLIKSTRGGKMSQSVVKSNRHRQQPFMKL
jgi:hypothetical protein